MHNKIEKSEIDILALIQNTKNIYCLSDILQDIRDDDLKAVLGYIPVLLKHRSWIIRSDALDMIGAGRLTQFKNKVSHILKNDKNSDVKSYALMAYYDLEGKKAIHLLESFITSRNIEVKKTAYCLLYIATRRKYILKELEKIVKKWNTIPQRLYSSYVIFDHYMDLKKHPELLDLFVAIIGRFKHRWQKDGNLVKLIKHYIKRNRK